MLISVLCDCTTVKNVVTGNSSSKPDRTGRDGKFVKQSKMLNNSAYSRLGNKKQYAPSTFQSWGHNKNTCQNKDRLGYRSDKGNGNLGFVKTTVNKTVFIKEKRKEEKNFFLADFEKKLYRNIFQSTVYIHVDRTIPLLYNSEISSLEPSSVVL